MIWHRPVMQRATEAPTLRRLISEGYLVVAEFDDHPMRWPLIAQNEHLSFRGVHAIQTSTPALAAVLRQWNPNVAVFPNMVRELPPLSVDTGGEAVTLFFGAMNREEDWQDLMPALNRIVKKFPGKVHVTVVHDRRFFDELETNEKSFTPLCGYDEYRKLLLAADIALLPLKDTEFNRMKSDLKFIEAAAHGTVALAGATIYAETMVDGETGMIFRNPEEFEAHLMRLIVEPETRAVLAGAAYDWVKENRLLSQHFLGRQKWYEHLLDNFKKLNDDLKQREPSLFSRP